MLKNRRRSVLSGILVVMLIGLPFVGWRFWLYWTYSPTRDQLIAWVDHPESRAPYLSNFATPCPGAPFLLPSVGFVGFLFNDHTAPYNPFNPHPGIDIFGNGDVGTVEVRAAYDGYLTRRQDWKSSVIIRIPKDPLDAARQIWTYYTHMASESGEVSYIVPDFPPGTSEKFVKQGTLLGYQGLYAGDPNRSIAMHVHFSVVLSDNSGAYRNETHIANTLDPSPYFGFTVNAANNPKIPVRCGT